ncbi:DNA helicase [Clostridiales bacterium PH28_bin88]|nr:DNA helicase [Clostridiales bacterium PH28_bin88]
MLERVPPQNLEAEQAVLGSMMLDREAVFTVMEFLRPEDFYRDAHRAIYQAILFLAEKGEPVDLLTVTDTLRGRGELDKAGGATYVASLANVVPTAANAAYYARIVSEKSLLRSLIHAAANIAQQGYDGGGEVSQLLDQAEKAIFDISQRRRRDGFSPIRDVLVETMDQLERLAQNKGGTTGVPTFRDLDRLLSGLHPSDLIIVAARPGMGKTSFCLNIAQNVAVKHRTTVAVFSLEMSKEQLVQRMLSAQAMIDQYRLRTGYLQDEDWQKISQAVGPLYEAPIFIDDTPGISVMEVRAKARRLKTEQGLGLVIIDYLQLMQASGRRAENRQQEISEISRSLKAMARELDVPVLALSQLSRAVEQSHDKRPSLSHLRESGALEQDSDCVIFIHRPEYYDQDTEKKGIAEIIVAKHRHGPTGTVEMAFLPEFTRFVDLAKDAG